MEYCTKCGDNKQNYRLVEQGKPICNNCVNNYFHYCQNCSMILDENTNCNCNSIPKRQCIDCQTNVPIGHWLDQTSRLCGKCCLKHEN